jgi:outer membrane beta-barrel protein
MFAATFGRVQHLKTLAVVFAVMVAPATALAQGLGLDLSDESAQKKEQPKQPQEPQIEAPPPLEETGAPKPKKEALLDEKDITEEDRVKAVQRKLYLKTHRFELAGTFGGTVNDPFYAKTIETLKLSYFPADSLGIGVRVTPFQVFASDDVSRATADLQASIHYSQPQWGALAEVEWSAVYGKATIFNTILHFDAYLLGGVGIVSTAQNQGLTTNPAADLGFGFRFAVLDWLAIKAEYINLSYVDQPVGSLKTSVQNLQMPMIGVSLFVPFKSTGRESE